MLRDIGAPELIIILALALLLFGAGRVGQLGKELGTAIAEFRRGLRSSDDAAEASGKDAGPS